MRKGLDQMQKKSSTGLKTLKNSTFFIYFRNSEEIYNYAKYNFHVLEWAIKEIVKEEKEEQEAREKQEKELLETNKSQTVQV